MIGTGVVALKVTLLLIAGCTGTDVETDDVGDCPTSSYVEQWTGVDSMAECNQYIRSREFRPDQYMPGYPSYVVGCKDKPSTM